MAFLVFADIFGVWVFPLLLGLLAVPGSWAYVHLFLLPLDPTNLWGWDYPMHGLLAFGVYAIANGIGASAPHWRETPAALWSYCIRFVLLMLVTEGLVIGLHLVLSLLLQALRLDWGIPVTILCGGLGWLILDYWATRAFLWQPLPETGPELVRGHDLEESEDISWKAWLDV